MVGILVQAVQVATFFMHVYLRLPSSPLSDDGEKWLQAQLYFAKHTTTTHIALLSIRLTSRFIKCNQIPPPKGKTRPGLVNGVVGSGMSQRPVLSNDSLVALKFVPDRGRETSSHAVSCDPSLLVAKGILGRSARAHPL